MSDELDDLIGRAADGDASPEDLDRLAALAEGSSDARDRLLRALLVDQLLSLALRSDRASDAFTASLATRLEAEADGDAFVRRLETELRSEPAPRHVVRRSRHRAFPAAPPAWLPGVVAAAALALFAVLLALAVSRPAGRGDVAVRPPAPEPFVPPAAPAPRSPSPTPPAPPPSPSLVVPAPAPPPVVPTPPAPAPPAPPPLRPPPTPPAPATAVAAPALAKLDAVEGEAWILSPARRPVAAGDPLPPGAGLETSGLAALAFPDGTRAVLHGPGRIDRVADDAGLRLDLALGRLLVDVTPRPADRPLQVVTAQAVVRVLGTRFTTIAADRETRVEVEEGRVRVSRPGALFGATVAAGQFAVVAPGIDPVARPLIHVLLAEDFAGGRADLARWEPVTDGYPVDVSGGRLAVAPRSRNSFATNDWHTPGGLRTRAVFPLPLRITAEVELGGSDDRFEAVIVVRPPGPAGGPGDAVYRAPGTIHVARRGDALSALAENAPLAQLASPRPARAERWTVELDAERLLFRVDERVVVDRAHGLRLGPAVQVGFEAAGKRGAPETLRASFDALRIEKLRKD
jgi:hypothetical protein